MVYSLSGQTRSPNVSAYSYAQASLTGASFSTTMDLSCLKVCRFFHPIFSTSLLMKLADHPADTRLRTFPFPTRRPTQAELARCLLELTRVKVSHLTEDALRAQDEAYLASLPKPKPAPSAPAPTKEKEKVKVPKLSAEEEALRAKWTSVSIPARDPETRSKSRRRSSKRGQASERACISIDV